MESSWKYIKQGVYIGRCHDSGKQLRRYKLELFGVQVEKKGRFSVGDDSFKKEDLNLQ